MTPASAVLELLKQEVDIEITTTGTLRICFDKATQERNKELLEVIKNNKPFVLSLLQENKDLFVFLATLQRHEKHLQIVNNSIVVKPEPISDNLLSMLNRIHRALVTWLEIPQQPCVCGSLWFWRTLTSKWYCWKCHFWVVPCPNETLLSFHATERTLFVTST